MPDQEEIARQLRLLEIHRRTLADWRIQQAQFGLYTPPYVLHSIREARTEIARCKTALRDWGAPVQDLPDDELFAPDSASQQIKAGFTALADLMSIPEVRAQMLVFQHTIESARRQIDLLADYKDLHDLLHQLQYSYYRPITYRSKPSLNEKQLRKHLIDHKFELQTIITKLWAVLEQATFPTDERTWIQELNQTADILCGAIETISKEVLERAFDQIGRILYQRPIRINVCLKEAARNLPLLELIQAMNAVREQPAHQQLDPSKLHQIGGGVRILEQIYEHLKLLVSEHDTWQEIDLELRRIEDRLEHNLKQLQWLWPDLKARTAPLYRPISDRRMQEFQQACAKLEQAILSQQTTTIVAHFRGFRSQAGLCFYQADIRLKQTCKELRHFEWPLVTIMRMIG